MKPPLVTDQQYLIASSYIEGEDLVDLIDLKVSSDLYYGALLQTDFDPLKTLKRTLDLSIYYGILGAGDENKTKKGDRIYSPDIKPFYLKGGWQ